MSGLRGFVVTIGALAAVLVWRASPYGSWIVDDAGITLAYARNAAEGLGWVHFPGVEPVEGFTNALWAWVLAGFAYLGLLDPVWLPKVLGLTCVLVAGMIVRHVGMRTFGASSLAASAVAGALCSHASIVTWAASGLENGLYTSWTAGLLMTAAVVWERPGTKMTVTAGLLGGLAFGIRPDGLWLAAIAPIAIVLGRHDDWRARLRQSLVCAGTSGGAVLLITSWRVSTFGDFVPNTFRAKVGSPTAALPDLTAALAVGTALAGCLLVRWSWPRLRTWRWSALHALVVYLVLEVLASRIGHCLGGDAGAIVLALSFASAGSRTSDTRRVWPVAVTAGLVLYESLPADWMGLDRFGSPFVTLALPWVLFELGARAHESVGVLRLFTRLAVGAYFIIIVTRSLTATSEFVEQPVVPMATVQRNHERMAGWAHEAGVQDPTVLVADVGGAMWSRQMEVVDLAGLCERTVASLRRQPTLLADWILHERQPTFIQLHDSWSARSGLFEHADFRRDYLTIEEWPEVRASQMAGHPVVGGLYIRRENAPDAATLSRWRD